MKDIKPPKQLDDYPDRALDCEFELEPAFGEVALKAEKAGWSEAEVAAALLSLAKTYVEAVAAYEETDKQIEAAFYGTPRN